jgi:hypothetical protein
MEIYTRSPWLLGYYIYSSINQVDINTYFEECYYRDVDVANFLDDARLTPEVDSIVHQSSDVARGYLFMLNRLNEI